MKIAIDLRSLQSGSISGVENYTINLLGALLQMDKKNEYKLFYNSFSESLDDTDIGRNFRFVNSQIVKTGYPNRLLNLGLMARMLTMEKILGDFDVLFMPNLNQFNISPNAKLAITVHDLSPVVTPEFYDLKRTLWHKFLNYRRAFQRANVIFAVSEYTKRDLVKIFHTNPEKIKVVYPGIDDKFFNINISNSRLREARNKYGLPGEFFLFLNTVEPRKNLNNLLAAFADLGSRADLVIVGRKGWKHRAIFREIQNSPKSAKIKYIGYVDERDKPAIIKLGKALVYPSFYEGFGFQPLEAMAVGTPAIVSQVTSLPEVVGDAALLVNPYNIDDIRKAMDLLSSDEGLRNLLITKGQQRVKQYSWQNTAAKILNELNKL